MDMRLAGIALAIAAAVALPAAPAHAACTQGSAEEITDCVFESVKDVLCIKIPEPREDWWVCTY